MIKYTLSFFKIQMGKCLVSALLLISLPQVNCSAGTSDGLDTIIKSHPRIMLNQTTMKERIRIAEKFHPEIHKYFMRGGESIRAGKKIKIPNHLEDLRDSIYKYGYLYLATKDKIWADMVVRCVHQIPKSISAYSGRGSGYAYALEGLAVAYDWCHDYIREMGLDKQIIEQINFYYPLNRENFIKVGDFHNYAARGQIAMLLAGIATQWENPKAPSYIMEARQIVEFGGIKDPVKGSNFRVLETINYVDGSCSWEGPTYGRRQLFAYIKYVEAIKSATNGKIDLWKSSFNAMENAGFYIIYSMRPDLKYEAVGDVNYSDLMYFDINNLSALQSAFQNGYFTAFLDEHVKWKWKKRDEGIWPGRGGAPLIFYLLWTDPKVKKKDMNEMPLSKKFGNTIIIRDGFGKNDTMMTFQSGNHWGFHSQLDHGSFTVFKTAPLAVDSGYYDNWNWGKKHNWNYWKRTIAHNSLLFYNPKDKHLRWPQKFQMENDGGQRIAWVSQSPPNSSKGSHNKPSSIDDLKKRFEEFRMGQVTDYESSDKWVYIQSDLTSAYNNKFAGKGSNPPKRVNQVKRAMSYLSPDIVIVYDSIGLSNRLVTPKWLLHSGNFYTKAGMPVLDGDVEVVEGTSQAGVVRSNNSEVVNIRNGQGKLSVFPLYPKQKLISRIGGNGYEFWYQGTNHRFKQETIPEHRRSEDPGAWRIEITPQKYDQDLEYLNILLPGLSSDDKATSCQLLESASDSFFVIKIVRSSVATLVFYHRDDAQVPDQLIINEREIKYDRIAIIGDALRKGYSAEIVQDENSVRVNFRKDPKPDRQAVIIESF